jgi:hypothetical protein
MVWIGSKLENVCRISGLILDIDISRILKAGWELSYLNNIFVLRSLSDMGEELIAEKPK